MSKVAVLGLGVIGSGLAKNLISSEHEVVTWNRSEKTGVAGSQRVSSIAEAVSGADFVLYCLSDDTAVQDVVFGEGGVLDVASKGQIVIDLSTISSTLSLQQHKAFSEKEVEFLDSPVFGSRDEAASGGLWIVAGGKREVFDAVNENIYPHISETTHYMGDAGNGVRMKLVGNLLVASQLQALAEAFTLAKASRLDLQTVIEVLDVTDFRTPIYSGVGRSVIAGDYTPNFALNLMNKDLGLIEKLSSSLGVSLPTVQSAQTSSRLALEKGYGEMNASALIQAFSQDQGFGV